MSLKIPIYDSSEPDATNAKFDAIFAAVRRCSGHDFWRRIQDIILLLERDEDLEIIEAVKRMDLLIESLRSFCERSHGDAYRQAKAHLLSAWRCIMRGDYPQARKCIELRRLTVAIWPNGGDSHHRIYI